MKRQTVPEILTYCHFYSDLTNALNNLQAALTNEQINRLRKIYGQHSIDTRTRLCLSYFKVGMISRKEACAVIDSKLVNEVFEVMKNSKAARVAQAQYKRRRQNIDIALQTYDRYAVTQMIRYFTG